MRHQGKISKWFDDKGYGFVSLDNQAEQVFAHISAFPKGQGRPVIGEAVTFEIAKDDKKGMQAYNILYASRNIQNRREQQVQKTKKQKNYSVFGLLVLITLGYFIWSQSNPTENIVNVSKDKLNLLEDFEPTEHQNFQCAGKTHCSQMLSCDEAKFYLKNCPGTIADGDGDGIPCEDQWCGH